MTPVLLTVLACHSVEQPSIGKSPVVPPSSFGDSSGPAATATAKGISDASAKAPTEAPLDWGTRADTTGPLYPIVDGMCIHGTIFQLENGAVFAYGMTQGPWSRGGATTAQLVAEEGLAPMPNEGFGKAFDFWAPSWMGGRAPDKLWAIVDVSSRIVSVTDFYTGGIRVADWKLLLPSGARFGDAGNAPTQEVPFRRLGKPIPWGEGSYAFPEGTTVRTSQSDKETFAFRVLGPDGAWVRSPKVPNADLAELALGASVVRLGNGEVLGLARGSGTKLVRWSPSKAVADLPLPKQGKPPVKLLGGKSRAYVEIDGELFAYDGDTISPVKVAPRLLRGMTWAIGHDDALHVVLPSGVALKESTDGTVTEETLPAVGILYGLAKDAPWLLVAGKGAQGSDMLYRKTAGHWEPVPIPAPPFGSELRGPLRVEDVIVSSSDDVMVNVRRIEKGSGWKDPEPFRAIYRTKRPREVLRCQDTRGATGVGLHSWPPAADDTCKTPVVTLLADTTPKPPKDYPNLRAKLRGKVELGETITLVNFQGQGRSNLAALVPDMAKAKALATLVSKGLDLRAEVVCGKPTPTRTFTFDVAKGTFAF